MTPGQRNGIHRMRTERAEGREPLGAADREQARLDEISESGPGPVAAAPKKKRKAAKRKTR